MTLSENKKNAFFDKFGGYQNIQNYEKMIQFFDEIYQKNIWDTPTVNRIKNICSDEKIKDAVSILLNDHKEWIKCN